MLTWFFFILCWCQTSTSDHWIWTLPNLKEKENKINQSVKVPLSHLRATSAAAGFRRCGAAGGAENCDTKVRTKASGRNAFRALRHVVVVVLQFHNISNSPFICSTVIWVFRQARLLFARSCVISAQRDLVATPPVFTLHAASESQSLGRAAPGAPIQFACEHQWRSTHTDWMASLRWDQVNESARHGSRSQRFIGSRLGDAGKALLAAQQHCLFFFLKSCACSNSARWSPKHTRRVTEITTSIKHVEPSVDLEAWEAVDYWGVLGRGGADYWWEVTVEVQMAMEGWMDGCLHKFISDWK